MTAAVLGEAVEHRGRGVVALLAKPARELEHEAIRHRHTSHEHAFDPIHEVDAA